MTLPYARTKTVLQTFEFLTQLARGRIENVPELAQKRAAELLTHFPKISDLHTTATACPGLYDIKAIDDIFER